MQARAETPDHGVVRKELVCDIGMPRGGEHTNVNRPGAQAEAAEASWPMVRPRGGPWMGPVP